ncbi:MAG: hypothetical protein HY683_10545 [Chloroflexi bacterium]|nr:hypothetical protein [Chloroflexota bacterium]
MFDAEFYRSVLPERVTKECHGRPDSVPVVNLYLANGRTLDLCHIVHLAESWFAVQSFRDAETCDDMDLVFLPYELVTEVTVSLYHPAARRMGFDVRSESALQHTPTALSERPA